MFEESKRKGATERERGERGERELVLELSFTMFNLEGSMRPVDHVGNSLIILPTIVDNRMRR